MRNIRLSNRSLKDLVKSPSSGSKMFMWDLEIPGFGAFLTASGRVSFVYQYRMRHGKPRRTHLGYLGELTVDQARDHARTLAYKRRAGIDPIEELREAAWEKRAAAELGFTVYATEYLARRAISDKPLTKAQSAIITERLIPYFKDRRIDQITVEDVEKLAATLADQSTSAHRSGLTYLKVLFNDAKRRRKIVASPAEMVRTPSSNERDRVLRSDEMQRLLEAAHDLQSVHGDALQALARLMKRKDEVLSMTWQEIDQHSWTWHLGRERSKNNDAHTIILPKQVVDIIERQQPDKKLRVGYVFTLNRRNGIHIKAVAKNNLDALIHRRLELSNQAQGMALTIAHFTLHDLRTAGATTLQGKPFLVSSEIIDAILLHKPAGKVTRTYQRNKYVPEAAEALQKWNDYLDELMSNADAWPGGKSLPPLSKAEITERNKLLRRGWPKRAHQKSEDADD